MYSDEDDSTLVAAARSGDKEALGALLSRHWPMLLRLCTRMVDDPTVAQDAAQDAAVQALLGLDRLRRPEQFGAWLSGIGLNICRRWLQDRKEDTWSLEALSGNEYVSQPLDSRAGPDEVAEEAAMVEQVRHAVAELPPGQRRVVMLFYLQGLTHAETAAVLGIGIGAVKTRLHNARGTLRQNLSAIWKEQHMDTGVDTRLVEMFVADVRRRAEDGQQRYLVLFKEVDGDREITFWQTVIHGRVTAMNLKQAAVPGLPPSSYTLMANMLDATGGRVHEVQINRLTDEVVYATIIIEAAGRTVPLESNWSDAVNLALVTRVPIRVETAVIEAAQDLDRADRETQQMLHGVDIQGASEIVAEFQALIAAELQAVQSKSAG